MLELTPAEREEWGRPEVLNDPVKAGEFDERFMAPWLLERNMRDIAEEAQAAGVMSTPYNTPEGLLNDPHFGERGYLSLACKSPMWLQDP
jgi:crotonobetainyl-CoA:carnitine CoA-transferase CaiB-like acyl-CoA transferase